MTIRGLVLAALLACGCTKKADWHASRGAYCRELSQIQLRFEQTLGSGDPTLSDLQSCNDALASAREALGLLHGYEAAESALYAGAPDDSQARGPFVTSSALDTALIALAIGRRQELLHACANGNPDGVHAWIAALAEARKQLRHRVLEQERDCLD
jgi:hypothetical protein